MWIDELRILKFKGKNTVLHPTPLPVEPIIIRHQDFMGDEALGLAGYCYLS